MLAGIWLQDTHCKAGSSEFDTTNSRSIVALGLLRGREECVEMDSSRSVSLFYRNQKCRNGRNDYEEFQEHTPPTWQPKCIVVSLAVKSRAELRDQLVEQGRILVHPLRLSLNYTTTLSEDPDHELASVNCALGRELVNLHRHDQAGQELTDKYLALKRELEVARKQFEVFNKIYMGLSAYRPPISPPPPSAPPSVMNAPPAAPEQVSLGVRNDQLRQRVEDLEIEVDEAAEAVESCIPSKFNICGRSSIAAPDPWISASGRPCAGNATREAIEGFYCGYWGSPVNPDAADSEVAAELLSEDGAPYCFAETGEALKCPVTADRTNRAGVYELAEWARVDRPYCESDFFRELNLDNASATVAECRETLLQRIETCRHGVCPQCISPCIYPVARVVGTVLKCMNMQKHFGFVHYYHTTDAGQLARSLHGAIRKDNYKPVPEKLAAHLYHIGHDNPKGYVQRDSISCRKDHRSSPLAHFAPGFDEEGMPISRTGYMHQCAKHSDCLACGRHPITSQQFKCQKRYVLYDTVMTDQENNLVFLNLTSGSASAFDPDLEDGARTGKTGICVDIDSSYNEGCSNKAASFVKDGAIGCMDDYVGAFLCGLSLDVMHGDLSTVSTSGNLFWPRVLIEGADDEDGDGKSPSRVTCTDPVDCPSKCRMLDRTSRNGAGAPPTCALCNQYCPSNIVTTITDLRAAIFEDVFGVIRLIGLCFAGQGVAGCICNFISTLEPEWRRVSTSEKVRCENGDPFELIVEQLNSQIIDWSQWGVNQLLTGLNHFLVSAFGWLGVKEPGPFDLVCFEDPRRPKKCEGGGMTDAERLHFEECESEAAKGGLDMTCYYHRVSPSFLFTAHTRTQSRDAHHHFKSLRSIYVVFATNYPIFWVNLNPFFSWQVLLRIISSIEIQIIMPFFPSC